MITRTAFFILLALFLSFLTSVNAQQQEPSSPIQGDIFSTQGDRRSDCKCNPESARRSVNKWYQIEQETIKEWKGFAKDSFDENITRAKTAQARKNAQTIYQQNLTDIQIYSQRVEKLYQCALIYVGQCCKGGFQCDDRNYNDNINTNSNDTNSQNIPDKKPKPTPTRTPNQTSTSNQKQDQTPPDTSCNCKTLQISAAAPTSIARIQNLQEVAEIVFNRYNTGRPIGIIKITSSTHPQYLIALAGTEYFSNTDDTRSLMQDDIDEVTGKSSGYREAVLRAIEDAVTTGFIEPNSKLIIAGHSLGGIIAQRIAMDNRLKKQQLEVAEVITFGSPRVGARTSATKYVFVEHKRDEVLILLKQRSMIGTGQILTDDSKLIEIDEVPTTFLENGFHSVYPQSNQLAAYDVLGQKNSKKWFDIEPNSFLRYSAPRKAGVFVTDAESIGEEMMNKWATQNLHYQVLLSPAEASNYRQGFDGLYCDPKTNTLVIGEAKGGYNGKKQQQILEKGYGFKQGTIEWARAAAQEIVKARKTNDKEVKWAEIILCILGVNHNLIDPNDKEGKKKLKETEVGLLRLPICKQIRACQTKVRIELFHTEIKNGRALPAKHYVLDKYP